MHQSNYWMLDEHTINCTHLNYSYLPVNKPFYWNNLDDVLSGEPKDRDCHENENEIVLGDASCSNLRNWYNDGKDWQILQTATKFSVMHMMPPMLLTVGVMPSSCMRKRILIIVIGSMLIVVPIGRANLTTFGLILFFSSRHLEVMGSAARLDEVAMAVGSTSTRLSMYL